MCSSDLQPLDKMFDENQLPHVDVLTICTFGPESLQIKDIILALLRNVMRTSFIIGSLITVTPFTVIPSCLRSDGCTGQFKCGRHFRWLSTLTLKQEPARDNIM